MTTMTIRCVSCGHVQDLAQKPGMSRCARCGMEYQAGDPRLAYDYRKLLFER